VCLPGAFGGGVAHHHTFSDLPEFTEIVSKAVWTQTQGHNRVTPCLHFTWATRLSLHAAVIINEGRALHSSLIMTRAFKFCRVARFSVSLSDDWKSQ